MIERRHRLGEAAAKSALPAAMLLAIVACRSATTSPAPPQLAPAMAPSTIRAAPPPDSPAVTMAGLCPGPAVPAGPLEFGQCVLSEAMTKSKVTAKVSVVLATDPSGGGVAVDQAPESYSIIAQGDGLLVVGRDAVGAMYGALDVAERVGRSGAGGLTLSSPVKQSPALKLRAANLFLTLPDGIGPWWFRDPAFWNEYLDMMARGRMNFLDLHAMYESQRTEFPNALLYFASSASMPDVGAPKADRETNLATLNQVIAMATLRGIKVGLMSYRADFSLLANEKETDEERARVPVYTREAVADLASRAPGLSYLGFRVGESQRKPDWYLSTFVAGLKDAHAHAVAYTRTWGATKSDLLAVVAATGPDTIIEAKFNGEHLGPPYAISGGGMEKFGGYSFQDYLTPPAPYQFVFQVRAGGTHRIFRYASYARTKRSIQSMLMSPRVTGFTLEAAHAYLPQRDFYHANPADSFSPWAFRRDELSYLLFGRLGYDPNTPESVFRGMLEARVGTDGLWDAVQAASNITPLMMQGNTCGPDQRDYAPELELAGPIGYWATPFRTKGPRPSCGGIHGPFDQFAMAGPYDAADDLLNGRGTSRVSPVDLALIILGETTAARAATQVPIDPSNAEARDVVRECVALADLGEYFAHKVRGATALAVYEGGGASTWLEAARADDRASVAAFTQLATDTDYIQPFDEHMRMKSQGLGNFHWRKQIPRLAESEPSIDAIVERMKVDKPSSRAKAPLPDAKKWLTTPRHRGPGMKDFSIAPLDPGASGWTVTVTLAAPPPKGAVVSILHRPFRSDAEDWTATVATGRGTTYSASVQASGEGGGMFAAEVNAGPGHAWRYPDVLVENPYRALAP